PVTAAPASDVVRPRNGKERAIKPSVAESKPPPLGLSGSGGGDELPGALPPAGAPSPPTVDAELALVGLPLPPGAVAGMLAAVALSRSFAFSGTSGSSRSASKRQRSRS